MTTMIPPQSFTVCQRIGLILLLSGWGALLFGGFLLAPTRHNRRIPRWARLLSSLLLVAAGWSWWRFSGSAWAQGYALRIACGMSFGLLGDLFLSEMLLVGKKAILAGMTAFGIGHLFYISAILQLAARLNASGVSLWSALFVFWLLGLGGWYVLVFRSSSRPGALHWAALPYALLLATTAGLAAGVSLHSLALFSLALGALLFLLSDLILARALFSHREFPLHHDIVWLTYGTGQMLIVFSIGAALML